jgi:sialate O-acetylesterase
LIGSNWGGTKIEPWTAKVGLEQVESLKTNAVNGGIYNGMIHPLAPYSMRGAIWYQGESNCLSGDTTIYTDRTAALVKGWQSVFQQDDLSFYFVQLAPFRYSEKFKKRNKDLTVESLPRFWDAQTASLETIPNSGMVVISDITGDVGNIHPVNKRDVGKRLARWALAKNYGKDDTVYSGPMYRSMAVEGGKVTLSFDHIGGGLASLDGKPLSEFTIAGGDHKFVPAEAKIQGETIVLSAAGVKAPVAVRYAWHETAIGNFGNEAVLPAVPFRTDDWQQPGTE